MMTYWMDYPENFPEPYELYLVTYINGEGKPETATGVYEDGHGMWYIHQLHDSIVNADYEKKELDRVIAFAEMPEPADIPASYEWMKEKGFEVAEWRC